MKLIKSGLKDSIFYLIGDSGSKILRILLLPLITQTLSIEDFGLYDIILLSVPMLTMVMSFGLDSGFAVMIAQKKEQRGRIKFFADF